MDALYVLQAIMVIGIIVVGLTCAAEMAEAITELRQARKKRWWE